MIFSGEVFTFGHVSEPDPCTPLEVKVKLRLPLVSVFNTTETFSFSSLWLRFFLLLHPCRVSCVIRIPNGERHGNREEHQCGGCGARHSFQSSCHERELAGNHRYNQVDALQARQKHTNPWTRLVARVQVKLQSVRVALFVVSSTGDGDPPENAESMFNAVRRKSHAPDTLAGLRYSVLGEQSSLCSLALRSFICRRVKRVYKFARHGQVCPVNACLPTSLRNLQQLQPGHTPD